MKKAIKLTNNLNSRRDLYSILTEGYRVLNFQYQLPSSKIIITAINKILKAFEDATQMELIKARWEEIKRLQAQPVLVTHEKLSDL